MEKYGGDDKSMKKILVIQSSGKAKGNTAQLVDSFVKGAEENGPLVEVISLVKNEVKPCLGCNACRYEKPCIQKDAFNDLVPKMKEADCLVFALPLYFWSMSARIKACFLPAAAAIRTGNRRLIKRII